MFSRRNCFVFRFFVSKRVQLFFSSRKHEKLESVSIPPSVTPFSIETPEKHTFENEIISKLETQKVFFFSIRKHEKRETIPPPPSVTPFSFKTSEKHTSENEIISTFETQKVFSSHPGNAKNAKRFDLPLLLPHSQSRPTKNTLSKTK